MSSKIFNFETVESDVEELPSVNDIWSEVLRYDFDFKHSVVESKEELVGNLISDLLHNITIKDHFYICSSSETLWRKVVIFEEIDWRSNLTALLKPGQKNFCIYSKDFHEIFVVVISDSEINVHWSSFDDFIGVRYQKNFFELLLSESKFAKLNSYWDEASSKEYRYVRDTKYMMDESAIVFMEDELENELSKYIEYMKTTLQEIEHEWAMPEHSPLDYIISICLPCLELLPCAELSIFKSVEAGDYWVKSVLKNISYSDLILISPGGKLTASLGRIGATFELRIVRISS